MTTTINGSSPSITFSDGSAQTSATRPFQNRIINGAMVIDQRNAGASVTPTAAAYTLDRWDARLSVTSKYSVQQVSTAPAGFVNSLKVTSLSAYSVGASETFGIQQVIEGYNIADLGWGTASAKTVTLSFQVYSSLTGTFGGSLRNAAGNRSYPFTYSIPTANTWTPISITVAGDTTGTWETTNSGGIYLQFGLGAGATFSGTAGAWASANYTNATGATSVVGVSGATFFITGCQLEIGSTATSFDYRPYGTELALCQRYFQRFGGNSIYETYAIGQAYNTTSVWATIPLKVNMRANPTFSPTSGANLQLMNVSGTGLNCTACDIGYGSTTSPDLFPAVASGLVAGDASVFRSAGTTSGFISFSAEL